jgi:hypothetical protein
MSTEENKAIVRRFFEEEPSKGNMSAAIEFFRVKDIRSLSCARLTFLV